MDVELYVYDLSRGLARQMSLAFLGIQIDAVYHTALVFGGVEYFFGAGIQTSAPPGATHHGAPMQRLALGRTELPPEVIVEYIDSLRDSVYTAGSYDLFAHNCNNFSNDLAMFLVGKGIPDHITSLPQRVMDTPFGQMLRPQLDQAMRGVTQAPVPVANRKVEAGSVARSGGGERGAGAEGGVVGKVRNVVALKELEELLGKARDGCAVVFFTSSTCAPCKICYAPYDELAAEFAGKVTLVKVDIGFAMEISSKYKVRATPTFMTFLKGEKTEEWSGADPAKLRANVKMLVQMAHPLHPHKTMRLPKLQQQYKPSLYTAVPPLEKLVAKLGTAGQSTEVQALQAFVQKRYKESAADAKVPDLKSISAFVKSRVETGQDESLFALIDLLRVAAVDPRISGYLVEDSSVTVWKTLEAVCEWDSSTLPATRLVTMQLACNLFSTPLLTHHLERGAPSLTRLATWLLLDEASSVKLRECAATLIQNIAAAVHSQRLEDRVESLSENHQVELAVCLLENVQQNEEPEVLKRSLLALGMLGFGAPQDGELKQIVEGMDAASTLKSSGALSKAVDKALLDDVVKVVS